MNDLGENAIPGPPNWALPLIGAVLFVAGFVVPEGKQRALMDDSRWDKRRWFAHAENLLRGRYLFSREQALETLRKAKEHYLRAEIANSPASEFGNVEVLRPNWLLPVLQPSNAVS